MDTTCTVKQISRTRLDMARHDATYYLQCLANEATALAERLAGGETVELHSLSAALNLAREELVKARAWQVAVEECDRVITQALDAMAQAAGETVTSSSAGVAA